MVELEHEELAEPCSGQNLEGQRIAYLLRTDVLTFREHLLP